MEAPIIRGLDDICTRLHKIQVKGIYLPGLDIFCRIGTHQPAQDIEDHDRLHGFGIFEACLCIAAGRIRRYRKDITQFGCQSRAGLYHLEIYDFGRPLATGQVFTRIRRDGNGVTANPEDTTYVIRSRIPI